jgi:predicted PurR-regulated permease PerM
MKNNSIELSRISPFLNLAGFIIVIAGIMYASDLINPLLLALFISIICAQPLAWLERRNVSHGLAIAIVLSGALLIFFGLGQLIAESVYQFSNSIPKYTTRFEEISASASALLEKMGVDTTTWDFSSVVNTNKIMGFIAGIASGFGSIMGNVFLIVFIVVFLLLELNSFAVKTIAIVDDPAKSLKYLTKIGSSIRHYLGIKTVVSLLTGVLIWLSLLIIGVDYAIMWGIIAFLLNFIPNIGSIIAGLPALVFALVQLGVGGAIWTAIAYISVNMIVGNIVEPKVMGKGMGLSTLVVFLSLIFWGFILGTVGMFLSVPLTMTVKIILEQSEKTKWIAILLGTQQEAQVIIERNKYKKDFEEEMDLE